MTTTRKVLVRIAPERCKACGLCMAYCPRDALQASEAYNRMGLHPVEMARPEDCTGCGFCALVCPDTAVEIVEVD